MFTRTNQHNRRSFVRHGVVILSLLAIALGATAAGAHPQKANNPPWGGGEQGETQQDDALANASGRGVSAGLMEEPSDPVVGGSGPFDEAAATLAAFLRTLRHHAFSAF